MFFSLIIWVLMLFNIQASTDQEARQILVEQEIITDDGGAS